MTPVQAYSTAVLAVIAIGLATRRNRKVHIPVMLTAFALDLGSVVYLEIARHAVEKAASKPTPLLMVHISFAVSTLLLYIAMTIIGVRLARTGNGRGIHRAGAATFLVARVGTWATAFFTT